MSMEKNSKNKVLRMISKLTAVLCAISAAFIGVSSLIIPDDIALRNVADINSISASSLYEYKLDPVECLTGEENLSATASVFGIPIKNVNVNIYASDFKLCPGGQAFGIKMNTDGLIVVGLSDVESESGKSAPAIESGLRVGDIIISAGDAKLYSSSDLSTKIVESEGKEIPLVVDRNGAKVDLSLKSALSKCDGAYRAGIWVKDSTAGIGTVTYYNPEDCTFGGLGHGVCDSETGTVMPFGSGNVFSVTISGVVKGEVGCPGEIKGYFNSGKIGVMTANNQTGVYGIMTEAPAEIDDPVSIALKNEIHDGAAEIRCTLNDGKIRSYQVEIEKIPGNSTDKNMIVKIRDDDLAAISGGIIQGMSGSPIIQDGRLIGAVTHVMINDPMCGYGIYIENMLSSSK